MLKKRGSWHRYIFEFVSIFVGVSLAFALENWNEKSRLEASESKTLFEIKNGLLKDKEDLTQNLEGHLKALKSCDYFIELIHGKNVDPTQFPQNYNDLLRDYISIQNRSGYESLKSRGLELVTNDSLRLNIISIYDFYYEIVEKAEENYSELQFHKSYFASMNSILSEYFQFSEDGVFSSISVPLRLSKKDKNLLLTYLWKIRSNRDFATTYYKLTLSKIDLLIQQINEERAL